MSALGEPVERRVTRTGMPARRIRERLAATIIGFATVAFLLACSAGIADPGLQYDELLFVNGALGAPHVYHDFIYSEALGVPTMLMPYIGALKAWLYSPIFHIFGVSVDTIRLPAIVLAAGAILCIVVLVWRLMGAWLAALLAVLLTSDPVYGAVSRADWGPIVLSAVCRCAALLCYFALIRRRSVRYLWLLVVVLSLGLYNKLDFIWFIAALSLAAVSVHSRELLAMLRARPKAVLTPVVVMVALLIAAFFALILPATRLQVGGSNATLPDRVKEVAHLFTITFNGTGVFQYMTGSSLAHGSLIGALFPFILLGACAVVPARVALARGRSIEPAFLEALTTCSFFVVLFLVMAAGIVLTRQATGPQHVMLLWPLPALLLVCLIWCAAQAPAALVARVVLGVLAVAAIGLVFTQVRATSLYVKAYRSDRSWNTIWSPEIYAAAKAVERSAPGARTILAADWGLGTQVFALGDESVRGRFLDEWPEFSSPTANATALEQQWFHGQTTIVIFHTPAGQIMPNTTQHVESILSQLGARVSPIFVGRQIEADLVAG